MSDTSKDGLLLGVGIRHITATQAEVKEVPACVRKYCFNQKFIYSIVYGFNHGYSN